MNCPLCRQPSRVLTTESPDRRRECTGCKHRFTTTEVLKDEQLRQAEILKDARALAEKLAA